MEYFYIYKITCTAGSLKDNYYIGQRKCHCLPEKDSYKGSGKVIKDYYKKYPNDYVKEIICLCKDKDELNEKEAFYVGDLYKTDPLCVNAVAGGLGCHDFAHKKNPMYGRKHTEYSKKLMSINNGSHRQEVRDKMSKSRIKFCSEHPNFTSGDKNGMYGHYGELNPAYGRKWMNNGTQQIYATPDEINIYLEQGYTFGMIKKWMNNGLQEKFVKSEEINLYIEKGYTFGRLKKINK